MSVTERPGQSVGLHQLFASNDDEQEHFQRIGEVASAFNVTLRTLRFYEDKGLIAPKRVGSTRLFSKRDRVRLRMIIVGRNFGFTLREVKQMLDLYQTDTDNKKQISFVLQRSLVQLGKLEEERSKLDETLGDLRTWISELEGMSPRAA
jgi:DNA-binding transcriptional MerR regulator